MIELTSNGYYIMGAFAIVMVWAAASIGIWALPYSVIEKEEDPAQWRPTLRFAMRLAPAIGAIATMAAAILAYLQEGGILAMLIFAAMVSIGQDFVVMKRVKKFLKGRKVPTLAEADQGKGVQ